MDSRDAHAFHLRGGRTGSDEHFKLLRQRSREFRDQLDKADAGQAAQHLEALQKAASHHEKVRQDAEQARERYILEQQIAARQHEIQQEQAIARAREELQAREEQARLLREHNERAAAAEHQRRIDEANQIAAHEAARKQREEAEQAAKRKAKEDAEEKAREAERQRTVQPKPPAPEAQPRPTVAPTASQQPPANWKARDVDHQQYLDIHRELKQFRSQLVSSARQDKALKTFMGDNRREITKTVGQMTAGTSAEVKQANRGRISAVVKILQQALQHTQPSVDVRKFLSPSRQLEGVDASECQVPAVFIYLLNIFVKAVIKQYIGEAGISPEKAEPVGLLVANIFSHRDLQWHGTTYLIDILLAKFHKTCPVLFGIYGSNNTKEGRIRSGWLPISAQENSERMTGLGAGFASITSRDFSRAQAKNPMPVEKLWRSLAMIVNTPAAEAIDAHFLVLKALLEPVYVQKLVKFYGVHGVALVRKAVYDFPLQSATPAANALKVLPDIYKKQIDLVV